MTRPNLLDAIAVAGGFLAALLSVLLWAISPFAAALVPFAAWYFGMMVGVKIADAKADGGQHE